MNSDTDIEIDRYLEATKISRMGLKPEFFRSAVRKFNTGSGQNDVFFEMANGGHVKIGSEVISQPSVMAEAPQVMAEAPQAPELHSHALNDEIIEIENENPAASENTPMFGGAISETIKGLVRGAFVRPSQFLKDNFNIYDPLVLQIVNPETGEFDPAFRILSRAEIENMNRKIAAGEYTYAINFEEFVETDEEAGAGAQVMGEFAQFLGAYAGIGKLFRISKNVFVGGMTQGAAADFLAFRGDEGRLSDFLVERLYELGVPENQILNFMRTDPNDPDYVGRLKTAFEGGVLGTVAEPILVGIGKAFRAVKDADITQEHVLPFIQRAKDNMVSTLSDVVKDVGERLNQPGQMPTLGSNLGNLFEPGSVIPPSNKKFSATEINDAKLDTRKSASIVADRLNKIVLESDRVNGGSYKPGTPDGKKWSTLPANKLAQRGGGANFNDADLDRIWNETLAEVSDAAKNAVNETGATWQAFPAASWDKALSLPVRSQLWYELSGEDFIRRLPNLTQTEHMMFLDLVGATSARSETGVNLERSLAVLSQHLRGVPIDVDLTTPSTVTSALSRGGQNVSSDLANKTGMFSDTLGIVAGLPLRYPISVNDVWVGKAFGITDDQLTANQSLHEVFGKYMNKLREQVNANSLHEFPHESWQLQARQWVEMRATDQGVDTSKNLSIGGNDYAGEFEGIIKKLEDAGIDVPGGIITRDILMRPEFADALRPTTPAFRDAPKATVEFGTLLTDAGEKGAALFAKAREVGDKLTQKEYLQTLTSSMYSSGRGKSTIWERTIRLATGESDKLSRIVYPTSENPFAISGTFEGAAAPNIRVPLKDLNPDQIAYFNAMAGKGLKQKAMAAAEIRTISPSENLPEGFVETSSIFVPWTGNVPEELIVGVSNALGEGYEVSVAQYPNGLKIDVNPRFTDEGIESPNSQDIENVGQFLEKTYNVTNIEEYRSAYKSDYGKNYVEDDGTGKVYDDIIKTTLKGWTDEATSKIVELGVPKSIARQFINGKIDTIPKIDGKTSQQIQSIRGKARTIQKRLRTRIDNHNEMIVAWENLGNEINSKMESQLGSWEKRINKTQK